MTDVIRHAEILVPVAESRSVVTGDAAAYISTDERGIEVCVCRIQLIVKIEIRNAERYEILKFLGFNFGLGKCGPEQPPRHCGNFAT